MIIIDRQGDFESSQEGGGKEGPVSESPFD